MKTEARRYGTRLLAALAALPLALALTTCKSPLLGLVLEEVEEAVTPPEVVQVFPARSATDVPISTNTITITFTKPVDATTVAGGSIVISDESGTRLPGSFSVNGETVIFTPSSSLSFDTRYTIIITTAVRDINGNTLVGDFTWEFVTGRAPDTTNPVIHSITINGASEWTNSLVLSIEIDASDNYDTDETTSIAQMRLNDGEWIGYAPSVSYAIPAGEGLRTVAISVKDGSGNVSTAVSDTIKVDTTPPVLETFLLNGGRASTNSLDLNVYLFAKDQNGSGAASYKYRGSTDDWAAEWSDLVSNSAFIEGLRLPDGARNDDVFTYEAMVRDAAGNVSQSILRELRFDLLPPVVLELTPANKANDIPYNASVVTVTFDDAIDVNSITANTLVVRASSGAVPGQLALSAGTGTPNSCLQLSGLTLSPNTDYIATLTPVSDVAGNSSDAEVNWFFRTGDAIDSTAPTGSISPVGFETPLPNGTYMVSSSSLTMSVSAQDDYNSVYGMLVWGEGDLPPFESNASWTPFAGTITWNLDATQRTYSLLYRLMDSAGNISPSPVQVKVLFDTTAPGIDSFRLINGATHFNDPDGIVTLLLDADDRDPTDTYDGTGIKEIKYSNDANMGDDDWEDWSPIREDWLIDTSGEGTKTIYISIRDYLDNTYTPSTPLSVVWDITPPTISFDLGDEKVTNTETQLTGAFSDSYGIASYSWTQESGPENANLEFDSVTIANPTVSGAEDGSGDGVYVLRLTVRDQAGNESTGTVPFTWDVTPPAPMGALSAGGTYSRLKRPTISWSQVEGADKYLVSINGGASVEAYATSYTPVSDLPEGSNTIQVTAADNAGNTSASSSVIVFVDTIAPSIANNGATFLLNAVGTISGTTSDGGSGLNTHAWSMISGSGTVSFGTATAAATTATASQHGYYGLQLIVTDKAGNSSTGNFTLNWDTVPPDAPIVSGIARTPNTTPTWSWSSGGNGGSGQYQYRLYRTSDSFVYLDWTSFGTAIAFTPASPLEDEEGEDDGVYSYTLEVRERDAAGNISEIASRLIWIDLHFTAPPEVVVDGPSIQNTTSIAWDWTTGAAQTGATYRYLVQKNNTTVPSTPPFDSLSWINGSSGSVIETADYTADTASGEDETWTIIVEEKSISLGTWNGKLGSSTVRVDMKGPVAPSVTNVSPSPTNDSTPTWSWSSTAGTDSTGNFRYNIDGGAWISTTSTVATASSALTHGSHTLYVQEQDALGNWGTSGSKVIAVDIQAPTLTSITLKSGAAYTNSTSVTATIVATAESGMQMSIYDYNPAGWKAWETYSSSKAITLPSGEGNKYVYVKVRDALGNESAYVGDSIILDQTAPINVTVQLNGGATYTPSRDVYLDVSASDNYSSYEDWQLRYYYNGVYSAWQAFSAHTLADTNFTATAGNKTAYVQLMDGAGNTTSFYTDSIYLQIPSPTYAIKGAYTAGNTYVYYNSVTEDAGSSTTQYEIAYSASSTADPNNGSPVTSLGSTTSTTYKYVTGLPKGQLLYFFVRASNPDTGGVGPYSLTSVLGFSSNVTVVYDQGDSADEALAAKIKAVLEDTILSGRSIVDGSTIKGTMPTYTVTLLPEDLISNTEYATETKIYGDPVIVTHGMTLADRATTYDYRIRNIVSHGHGVIAIGSGNIAIDRVNANWASWALGGTQPADIGYLKTATLTSSQSAKFRPASTSESIWWSPIYNNYIYTNMGTETTVTANVFSASTGRYGVSLPSGAPTGGYIYAGDASTSTYYPVVRQGEFLTYGFFDVTRTMTGTATTYEYGLPFFVNLVSRMASF